MSPSLTVNAPHVVHETIDGEAILIHLLTGTYYSLEGTGAEVWNALATGGDRDGLVAAGLARYEGDPAEVTHGLSALVDELLREGLLVDGGAERPAGLPMLPSGQVPFVAPVLNTDTDMQEFMLVDPLHEVDEAAGWPHAKAG
jgi:hypothetical protein